MADMGGPSSAELQIAVGPSNTSSSQNMISSEAGKEGLTIGGELGGSMKANSVDNIFSFGKIALITDLAPDEGLNSSFTQAAEKFAPASSTPGQTLDFEGMSKNMTPTHEAANINIARPASSSQGR